MAGSVTFHGLGDACWPTIGCGWCMDSDVLDLIGGRGLSGGGLNDIPVLDDDVVDLTACSCSPRLRTRSSSQLVRCSILTNYYQTSVYDQTRKCILLAPTFEHNITEAITHYNYNKI